MGAGICVTVGELEIFILCFVLVKKQLVILEVLVDRFVVHENILIVVVSLDQLLEVRSGCPESKQSPGEAARTCSGFSKTLFARRCSLLACGINACCAYRCSIFSST